MNHNDGRPNWPPPFKPSGGVSASVQSAAQSPLNGRDTFSHTGLRTPATPAPPVYRPQLALQPLQPKTSAVVRPQRQGGAPPVYKPVFSPGRQQKSAYANGSSDVAQPFVAEALIGAGVGLAAVGVGYGLYRAYQWVRGPGPGPGPAPAPVLCSEGQHVTAAPNQGVNFGGVTSCMTLTCILADGSKVAGHLSQANYVGVVPGMLVGIAGRTVSKVIAAGTFGAWTPNLEDQATFIQNHYHGIPPATDLQLLRDFERLRPFAAHHKPQLRLFLQGTFGCATIRDVDFDEGAISVNAAGNDVQTNGTHNPV